MPLCHHYQVETPFQEATLFPGPVLLSVAFLNQRFLEFRSRYRKDQCGMGLWIPLGIYR